MPRKVKIVLSLLLCLVLSVIPLSVAKGSFCVQNVEKTAMVKSVGLDHEEQPVLSYVASVIDDSSAFHTQSVISASGTSFADAEKKAQILADKYVTFAYARHFIIGMPSAQKGIEALLNYLLASPVLQLSSCVYLCEGNAREMLKEISEDSISTNEVLTNLNLAGKEEGYYYPVSVLDCAKALSEQRPLLIPVIGNNTQGENTGKKTVLVFKGYAVLEHGRLAAVLTPAQSLAYNLLTDKVGRTVVECQQCDFVLKNIRCRMRFRQQAGEVTGVECTLRLHGKFTSFAGDSLADRAFCDACVEEEQSVLSTQLFSLFDFIKQSGLDILNLQKEYEMHTFGTKTLAQNSLQSLHFGVRFDQKQQTDFHLNGAVDDKT